MSSVPKITHRMVLSDEEEKFLTDHVNAEDPQYSIDSAIKASHRDKNLYYKTVVKYFEDEYTIKPNENNQKLISKLPERLSNVSQAQPMAKQVGTSLNIANAQALIKIKSPLMRGLKTLTNQTLSARPITKEHITKELIAQFATIRPLEDIELTNKKGIAESMDNFMNLATKDKIRSLKQIILASKINSQNGLSDEEKKFQQTAEYLFTKTADKKEQKELEYSKFLLNFASDNCKEDIVSGATTIDLDDNKTRQLSQKCQEELNKLTNVQDAFSEEKIDEKDHKNAMTLISQLIKAENLGENDNTIQTECTNTMTKINDIDVERGLKLSKKSNQTKLNVTAAACTMGLKNQQAITKKTTISAAPKSNLQQKNTVRAR